MNKIADQLGEVFRIRFKDSLKKPLNWRMIDALTSLDEKEEELRRQQSVAESAHDAPDGHEQKPPDRDPQ